MAGKAARAGQKIRKGVSAIESFANMVQIFAESAADLQQLGRKLRKGRNGGMKFKGRSGATVEARKKQVERAPKCRKCGKHIRQGRGNSVTKAGVITYQ